MCQIHKATAWTSHATSGIVSVRHARLNHLSFATLPTRRDHSTGNAQRKAMSGRPKTSRGAATNISISCCDMCAENSTRPHACTGETRATKSANHPPAKQSASHVLIDLRFGASRHNRRNPTTNRTPEINSDVVTSGSKLHARIRSCQSCGLPP